LNGNLYRPHLVVGDPNQRIAIFKTHTYEVEHSPGLKIQHTTDKWIDEEYAGVMFDTGPEDAKFGEIIRVKLTLLFWPGPQYEKLQPGKTFTVREGHNVVGFGKVLDWLPIEPLSKRP
jgi:hypothetical protein